MAKRHAEKIAWSSILKIGQVSGYVPELQQREMRDIDVKRRMEKFLGCGHDDEPYVMVVKGGEELG